MLTNEISIYKRHSSTENETITIQDYIGKVKHGSNQDAVINGRAAKAIGDIETYKKIKDNSDVVTPTGTFQSGQSKTKSNLVPNGIVCIDVDTELTEKQRHELYNDRFTFIIHKSFGGDGLCIWVKIDPTKLDDAYLAVSKYYFDSYGVKTDLACQNSNRLRYLSFDPDIVVNEKSAKFNVKVEKRDKLPQKIDYVFTQSDFDNILRQIGSRNIDLCDEDYYKYIRIGLSLADEFGESGRDYFHYICRFGLKYNERDCNRDYSGFIKNGTKVSIGTFYYYCREAGIEVYSEKTQTIINRVKISKSQGNPTVESVVDNLKQANNIVANEEDKTLIGKLINSNKDFSKLANQDKSEIEQVADFIVDYYSPVKDEITNTTYILNKKRLTDGDVNDIYINCLKNFDFNVAKTDIQAILNSSYVKKFNLLNDFIVENRDLKPDGYIEQYIKTIHPRTEYNIWAFKKWLVGAVHNWTSDFEETIVCPLTLVLTGQRHGTGKTTFIRNILPPELRKYITETKLDIKDKDSIKRLATSLIILDDEFGGKAFKDEKAYKDISDKNTITMRLPYGKEDETLKRRSILSGTSNEIDILKDVTGNRRILPINVERIDFDDMMKVDKTCLIMEAYNLLQSGFEWKIYTDEDINYIKENTQQNQAVIPLEEVFFNIFSIEKTGLFQKELVLNQGEILQILHLETPFKPTKFEIKEIFVKNKLSYLNHRVPTGQKKGVKLYIKYSDNVMPQSNDDPGF